MVTPPFSGPAERVRKWGHACAQHLAPSRSLPLIPFLHTSPCSFTLPPPLCPTLGRPVLTLGSATWGLLPNLSFQRLAHRAVGNSSEGAVAGFPGTRRTNSRLSQHSREESGARTGFLGKRVSPWPAACFTSYRQAGLPQAPRSAPVTGRGGHKDGGPLGPKHAGQKNARGPEEATGPRDVPRPWGLSRAAEPPTP